MPPVSDSSSGRFAHAGILALIVLVFAGVVAAVTLQQRADLREQILRQQGEVIAALVAVQLDNRAEELAREGISLQQAPLAVLAAVLQTTKWPGVAGVRVFNVQRHADSAWPINWSETPPSDTDWAMLDRGSPVVRRHPDASPEDIVGIGSKRRGVIETWVPMRSRATRDLLGGAQFWLEDTAAARELSRHDARLWLQAGVAWLMGSAVIVVGLSWAFRRLDSVNRELRARSEDLQRANRELVLAAKTSALGAVTAHLMHELKNPLAGLEVLVAGQAEAGGRGEAGDGGGELAAASELTRRLRTMVNDVVGVLRDEQTGADFQLTGADVAEVAAEKVQAEAKQRGVTVQASGPADVSLSGRRANLAILVLRNLLQNALEASARGGAVKLRGKAAADGGAEFVVEDSGGGLPAEVRRRLFQPCASTKVGGSGLGLALSYQLAQQAGGKIELVRSDASGTCFRLVLRQEA